MKSQHTQELLNDILSDLSALRKDDLKTLADKVFDLLSGRNEDKSVYRFSSDTKPSECKKCGSTHTYKYGKNSKGYQKYRCSDCGAIFSSVSSTVFCHTQKNAETWKTFILCTLEGRTLQYCADKCGISVPTAFSWRHKILNAMSSCQFENQFSGMIEVDEMFVRVSYKGNHSKSKHFAMPRPAFKRGSDNRSTLGKDKACVVCVAAREKSYSGIVTHRGALTTTVLSQVFDGHIADDTLVLTDESHAMKKYFSNLPCGHVALRSSITGMKTRSTVPVVKGPYHINNINALHGRFRSFLSQYKGVSTKHLNRYLSLFLWLENVKDKKTILDKTIDLLVTPNTHLSGKEISMLPLPIVHS